MNIADYIAVDPNVCHGKPCFKGTRIMVYLVLELLETGVPTEEIIGPKYYPPNLPENILKLLYITRANFSRRENMPLRILCDENIPGAAISLALSASKSAPSPTSWPVAMRI